MTSKNTLIVAASFAAVSSFAGFVSSPVAWKGEDATNFDISLQTGFMRGMAHEYVFGAVPSCDYEGTMSRLDWKIKNVAVGGLQGGARFGRLAFNCGFLTGIGKGSGNMMDYDWVDLPEMAEDQGFSYSETESDAKLEEFYSFDANVSYDLLRADCGLWASVFAGARYEHWRWNAFGLVGGSGFPEIGEWDDEFAPADEKIIAYRQEFLYGYLGARAGWTIGRFDLGAYAAWAPGYHVKDKDTHFARETKFRTDNDCGSHVALCGVSVSAAVTESLSVALAWDAINSGLAKTEGTQEGEEDEDDEDDEDDDSISWSGVKLRNHLFSLSVSYTF